MNLIRNPVGFLSIMEIDVIFNSPRLGWCFFLHVFGGSLRGRFFQEVGRPVYRASSGGGGGESYQGGVRSDAMCCDVACCAGWPTAHFQGQYVSQSLLPRAAGFEQNWMMNSGQNREWRKPTNSIHFTINRMRIQRRRFSSFFFNKTLL